MLTVRALSHLLRTLPSLPPDRPGVRAHVLLFSSRKDGTVEDDTLDAVAVGEDGSIFLAGKDVIIVVQRCHMSVVLVSMIQRNGASK